MSAIESMFDQILVRVQCPTCGPAEFKVGHLIGKVTLACKSCGGDLRLDKEPLKSHLSMLVDNAGRVDARRKRSGYVVRKALSPENPPGEA